MTRALITGLGGFVASHLAEYLLEHTDWDIWGTMRWSDPLDNLDGFVNGLHIVEMDLNDAGSVNAAITTIKPDYVFHLAAQSYVQASFICPARTLQTNVTGTLNLLEALRCLAPEAWVHNCSSSEVYGRVPADYGPIGEDCPLSPASPYSISKVGADMLGRHYAEAYGLRALTTRMFTHTGPRRGEVFAESSFAKQIAMIEAGLLEPPIKVGNLYSVRTIADVRDAVKAYHMLLTVNPVPGEAYNIGGDHTCMVGDILHALLRHAGKNYEFAEDPDRMRPLDADNQIPDCGKFTAHTGWKPEIPFERTMADLLAYWRDRVSSGAVVLQR